VTAPPAEAVRVAIVRCETYAPPAVRDALARGMELLGGWPGFVARGARVLVKPNLMAAMAPDRAQTTHPAVVRALVDLLRDQDATAFVGDNPVFGFRRFTYWRTGMTAALRGSGARLVDLSDTRRAARGFRLPQNLGEFAAVVSAPKLKAHNLMGMTGAVKNSYGLAHGRGARKRLHLRHPEPDDFARMLLDLNEAIAPRLHVVDAIVGAEGEGPRFGTPKNIGCLVLGADAIAVDFVLAALIGAPADRIATLRAAAERPEWRTPFARIVLLGDPLDSWPRPAFRIPERPGGLVGALPAALRNYLIRRAHAAAEEHR
jgi:uncharacterized protein (DUF362 family)